MPLALPLGEPAPQGTERAEKASLYWTRLRKTTHGSPVQGELAAESRRRGCFAVLDGYNAYDLRDLTIPPGSSTPPPFAQGRLWRGGSHTPGGAILLALPLGEPAPQGTERAEKSSLYWTRLRKTTHGSPVQGELAAESRRRGCFAVLDGYNAYDLRDLTIPPGSSTPPPFAQGRLWRGGSHTPDGAILLARPLEELSAQPTERALQGQVIGVREAVFNQQSSIRAKTPSSYCFS